MKFCLKPLLTVTILFLYNYNTVFSQHAGSIKGTVKDLAKEEIISGVQIFIEGESIGDVTDSNGSFEIKNVAAGIYTIVASMIGYETAKIENVRIVSGEIAQVTFKLKQEVIESEEAVVVYATKIPKSVKNIGGSVYMIDKKEIKQTECRNIEEVLTKIPGAFTEDRFHGESNIVSFRGVGLHTHVTRGILVLVDGISINEAMGRTSFEGIDLENVERIEVLKGPVSALYGPNGITGVLNIITKEPSNEFHSSLKASAGSYDTRKLSAMAGSRIGGYKFLIDGNYFHSGGYQDRSTYKSSKIGFKVNTNYNNFGIFDLSMNYSTARSDYAGPLDSVQFSERSTESTNKYTGGDKDLIRVNLKHQKYWNENTSLNSDIYYRSRYDEGHYRDTQFGKDNIQLVGAETKLNTSFNLLGNRNTIVLGVSADQEEGLEKLYNRVDSSGVVTNLIDEGKSIYQIIGIYLQNEYELSKKLLITAGLRYDIVNYNWYDRFKSDGDNSDDNSISAISPKLGLAYNPLNSLTVFGNVGIGFNPPQISQLFIGSSYSGLPNPDLKPEYLTNYEIGIRGSLLKKVNYQISFYNMEFENQIVAEGEPAVYQNIGDTRHQGVETSLDIRLHNNMNGYLSYSYLDARFIKHPDYEDNELRKTPKHQMSTGLRYMHPTGISAAVDYKWMDEYYMDNQELNIYEGHALVNAKFGYKWQNYRLSLSVNNIFDTNYATWAYASSSYDYRTRTTTWEKSYYPGWPRNFTLTIGINF